MIYIFNLTLSHTLFPNTNHPPSSEWSNPSNTLAMWISISYPYIHILSVLLFSTFLNFSILQSPAKVLPFNDNLPCGSKSHSFLLSLNSDNKGYVAPQNHILSSIFFTNCFIGLIFASSTRGWQKYILMPFPHCKLYDYKIQIPKVESNSLSFLLPFL